MEYFLYIWLLSIFFIYGCWVFLSKNKKFIIKFRGSINKSSSHYVQQGRRKLELQYYVICNTEKTCWNSIIYKTQLFALDKHLQFKQIVY